MMPYKSINTYKKMHTKIRHENYHGSDDVDNLKNQKFQNEKFQNLDLSVNLLEFDTTNFRF